MGCGTEGVGTEGVGTEGVDTDGVRRKCETTEKGKYSSIE